MRKFLLLAVFAVIVFPASFADDVAITVDNTTGQTLANPLFTLGWVFTTNQAITVTQLGVFDDSLDGLVDSYQVGIFDANGNLVGSTTVGTTDPLVNQFRYAMLSTTITLAANQKYEIGALFLDGNDPLIFPGAATNPAANPAINFVKSSFAAGGTLQAPLNSVSTDFGYFGPNFAFIPEPSTLVLLGSGILGLAGTMRRKLL